MGGKGMSFLNKKSWHTGGLPMIQKVWAAEQRVLEEQKVIEQLRKEKAEERKVEEVRRLQAAQGLITRTPLDRLEWMYAGQAVSQAVKAEEYLLGRVKEEEEDRKVKEAMQRQGGGDAVWKKNEGGDGGERVRAPLEEATRMREDPLMAIAREELRMRAEVASNPVAMRRIKAEVEEEKERRRERERRERRERKKEKKERKKRGRRRSRSRSDSSDSRSDGSGDHHHGRRRRSRQRNDDERRRDGYSSPPRGSRRHSDEEDNDAPHRRGRSPRRQDGPVDERKEAQGGRAASATASAAPLPQLMSPLDVARHRPSSSAFAASTSAFVGKFGLIVPANAPQPLPAPPPLPDPPSSSSSPPPPATSSLLPSSSSSSRTDNDRPSTSRRRARSRSLSPSPPHRSRHSRWEEKPREDRRGEAALSAEERERRLREMQADAAAHEARMREATAEALREQRREEEESKGKDTEAAAMSADFLRDLKAHAYLHTSDTVEARLAKQKHFRQKGALEEQRLARGRRPPGKRSGVR